MRMIASLWIPTTRTDAKHGVIVYVKGNHVQITSLYM